MAADLVVTAQRLADEAWLPARRHCWPMSPSELRLLAGKRVVVTRAADQAQSMVDDLREWGAELLLMPGIATVPLESTELAAALADIATTGLCSPAPMRCVFYLTATAHAPRPGDGYDVTPAVWPSVRRRLWRCDVGFEPDAMPTEFVGSALAAAMGDLSGAWLLLPLPARAKRRPGRRSAAGACVDDVAVRHCPRAADRR
ncbi:MAG: hypothetical protein R3A10_07350 [Caldilineaceae bacterium]